MKRTMDAPQRPRNGEAETPSPRQELERVEPGALEAIARGEVDVQVTTAKRFPRSIKRFREEALTLATLDQETAASCFYKLPPRRGRDGKSTVIEGPSVRLAEIAASCWGNLRCEARIVEEGAEFVTAQATAWDMERNVLVRIESRRRITDKSGNRYGEDMRAMTGNAAASIAFRNAVQRVIPNAFIVSIYRQARLVAVGDARTLGDRRSKAMEAFEKLGVSQDRVLAMLGKPSIDDVGLGDVETLLGVFTAIQEGTTSIEDAFPPESMEPGKKAFGFRAKQEAEVAAAKKAEPEQGEEAADATEKPDSPNPFEGWTGGGEGH